MQSYFTRKISSLFLLLIIGHQTLIAQLITQTFMGNDTVIYSGKVVNGKRDSLWTYQDNEKRIVRQMNYDLGKLSGVSYYYHYNGKIFGKENFTTGDYQYCFNNQKVIIEGNINASNIQVSRYADSSLQSVGAVINGNKQGKWMTLTKWKEVVEEKYENNEREGEAKKYDAEGNLLWTATYKKGKHMAPFAAYFPSSQQKSAEQIVDNENFAHFIIYQINQKKAAELIFRKPNSPLLLRTYYENQLPKAEYYLNEVTFDEKIYEQDFSGAYLKELENWEDSEIATFWERKNAKYLNYWKEDGTKTLANGKGLIPEFMNVELFQSADFLTPTEFPNFENAEFNKNLAAMLHQNYLVLASASREEKVLFFENWKPQREEMKLRTLYHISHGVENGWATTYSKNGAIRAKQRFHKGKPNGKFYGFYDNTKLSAKGKHKLLVSPFFKAKVRVGKWTFYHKNGQIAAVGRYEYDKNWENMNEKTGKKAGTWKYYDATGKLLFTEKI